VERLGKRAGLKTYFVWYRAGQGRGALRREYTVARHGEMTPEEARQEAAKVLSRVRLGEDPQNKRQRARVEMDVASLCEWYLRDGVALKKASTLVSDRARIKAHILPLLGSRPVSAVTSADVARFLKDVAAGKTAVKVKATVAALRKRGIKGRAITEADRRRRSDPATRGGKGTATRTVGLLGAIFTFAIREGLRSDNPVRGVERFPDQKSQRFLNAEELGRLATALRLAGQTGVNACGLNVIRLLMLTGARKSEIEGLRWSEVDFDHSSLNLADSKTGARTIPLGEPALTCIRSISRAEGTDYVFPSEDTKSRHYVGTPRVWAQLKLACDLPGVRIHDLRHTYASFGVASGLSLPMLGAILGHRDFKTTQQYAHLADDPVRAAADRTAGVIAAAMLGDRGNLVSFHR